jgi:ATP-dependent DNA helicase RecG
MNRTILTELIKHGQTDRLEFKSSLSDTNRTVEVVASFANTKSGTVVVGVRGKRIVGVDVGKRTIESLANKITDNIDPAIYLLERRLIEKRGKGKTTYYTLQ